MKPLIFSLVLILSGRSFGFAQCSVLLASVQFSSKSLEKFVLNKTPMTFEDALAMALANLQEGDLKTRFSEEVLKYFENTAPKIRWKAKAPKSSREAMEDIFRAIRLIVERESPSMNRFRIYFRGSQSYLNDFLNRAVYMVRLQDAVYSDYGENLYFPSDSRLKLLFNRYIRLLRNIFWLREYRPLRSVKFTEDFHQTLAEENEDSLEHKLSLNFSPDISIQWYLTHLRNIQSAGTFALAAILVPQISGAYFHEKALEDLESSRTEDINLGQAQTFLNQSDLELKNLIKIALINPQGKPYTPEELKFINDTNNALAEGK